MPDLKLYYRAIVKKKQKNKKKTKQKKKLHGTGTMTDRQINGIELKSQK
jgi:uncharacterized protein YcbK (DUF882 family)